MKLNVLGFYNNCPCDVGAMFLASPDWKVVQSCKTLWECLYRSCWFYWLFMQCYQVASTPSDQRSGHLRVAMEQANRVFYCYHPLVNQHIAWPR